MGRFWGKVTIILMIFFFTIQFYRPAKNIQLAAGSNDFLIQEKAPQEVQLIFKNSCYHCHSNYTDYYWYNNIAPVSWYVDDQVKIGKSALNFSKWGPLDFRDKRKAISQIGTSVKEGSMPPSLFKFAHENTVITEAEKIKIMEWLSTIQILNNS